MPDSPRPYKAARRGASISERLAAFPFLAELEPGVRERLLRATRVAHFDDETTLVRPSADVEAVPLVERGLIRVRRADESGKTLSLYDVSPGESCILALAGALRGGRYPAEAIAEGGTDVLLVDAEALREAFTRDARLQQFVLDLYSARFIDMMQLVREVAFDRLDVRLARLLLSEAHAGPGLWRPVEASHGELAAHLGSAREVVSRALGRLRKEGLVTGERSRTILTEPAALAARFGLELPD